jgi:predicted nucleic acid-binding protein
MIVPDINLLVYAHNDLAPQHAKARTWWEVLLNGQEPVGLPWIAMGGFILPPFTWIALAQSAGAMYFLAQS